MCNPFFYEFQVILSSNVFQPVCNIANLFTTEAVDYRGLTLIGIFLTLAGGERQGRMIYSNGSLQERAAWVGAAELRVKINVFTLYFLILFDCTSTKCGSVHTGAV